MCGRKVKNRLLLTMTILGIFFWITAIIYIQSKEKIDLFDTLSLDLLREGFSQRIKAKYRDSIQLVYDQHQRLLGRRGYRPLLPQGYNPKGLGENGTAVIVPAHNKNDSQNLFNRNHFNQWISDRISLHRTLPDPRHPM